MDEIKRQSLGDKMIRTINTRHEATQRLNPLTGKEYDVRRPLIIPRLLQDPIQNELESMELREPSKNNYYSGLLKYLGDRLLLFQRSFDNMRNEVPVLHVCEDKLYSAHLPGYLVRGEKEAC